MHDRPPGAGHLAARLETLEWMSPAEIRAALTRCGYDGSAYQPNPDRRVPVNHLAYIQVLDDPADVDAGQLALIQEAASAWSMLDRHDLMLVPREQTLAGVRILLVPNAPTLGERLAPARPLLELAVLVLAASALGLIVNWLIHRIA